MAKLVVRKAAPGHLIRSDGVVVASLFKQVAGFSFSGWVVRDVRDRYSVSDPIPTEALARIQMLRWTEGEVIPENWREREEL